MSDAENNDSTATSNTMEQLLGANVADALFDPNRIDILSDVMVTITIEVGRSKMKIRDLLALTKGSIIELDKLAGEPVDVYANGKLISMGNIIKANDKYCVKLISIPDTNETHK